jgi:ferric iron reductase protein FhuF
VAEESISIDFSTKTLSAAISETKKVMELLLDEEERLRQEGDTSEITFDQLAASKGLRSRQQQKEDREKERRPKIPDVANLLSKYIYSDENFFYNRALEGISFSVKIFMVKITNLKFFNTQICEF